MPDIILTTGPLGGLGDHCLYTTLPQRYSEAGHDVYLDQDNVCRNDEIVDLLWAMNPYIKGTSDKKPNAGWAKQGLFYDIANARPIGSIEAMERAHGFPPPYGMAPKIYYEPKPTLHDVTNGVLVDLNAISSTISPMGLDWAMKKINARYPDRNFFMLTFPEGIIREHVGITGPSIQVNSIYEYMDLLHQCHAWFGSEAGGQSLASAVRGEHRVHEDDVTPEVISVITPMTYNSRGYTYATTDYRVTAHGSNNTQDYFDPHEVALYRYELACKRTVEEAREIWRARKARDAEEALAKA